MYLAAVRANHVRVQSKIYRDWILAGQSRSQRPKRLGYLKQSSKVDIRESGDERRSAAQVGGSITSVRLLCNSRHCNHEGTGYELRSSECASRCITITVWGF